MSNTRYISLDCGKHSTKAAILNKDGSITIQSFRTNVISADAKSQLKLFEDPEKRGYEVEYDNTKYIVADNTNSNTTNDNSKADNIHKICSLTDIALLTDNGDTVDIVIGCPITIYADSEKRKSFVNYILPTEKGSRIDININGISKYFYIGKKSAISEALGPAFMYPEYMNSSTVGIIDIGGLNVNAIYMVDGSIRSESCFTYKLGSNLMGKKLLTKLEEVLDDQLDIDMLPLIMKNGYVTNYKKETENIIKEFYENHINEILNKCIESGWKIKFMKIMFIGGTSLMLKEQIENCSLIKSAFVPNDSQYINVKGFLKLLCDSLEQKPDFNKITISEKNIR